MLLSLLDMAKIEGELSTGLSRILGELPGEKRDTARSSETKLQVDKESVESINGLFILLSTDI
jgi:hypothetical protein